MKDTIRCRNFREEDYEWIEPFWAANDMGGAHRGDSLAVIRQTLAMGGRLLVLEAAMAGAANAEPVGTCWLTYDGRRVYLHHLAVSPEHRGRGLGKQLLEESAKHAETLKAQLKLEVHEENRGAIGLYQCSGFQRLSGLDVYIRRDTQDGPAESGDAGACVRTGLYQI